MDQKLVYEISYQIPCRDEQIRQLLLLLDPSIPNPSTIVVHGTTATAKSTTLRAVLSALPHPFAIVESRECITGRHLLERTLASVKSALSSFKTGSDSHQGAEAAIAFNSRVESLSSLTSALSTLLGPHLTPATSFVPPPSSTTDADASSFNAGRRFVLVFDGIDGQREAPATLMAAVARLGEAVPGLTVVLVVSSARARHLHRPGVAHVQFSAYTRDEAITVVGTRWTPPAYEIYEGAAPLYSDALQDRSLDTVGLWLRFVGAVWDSLGRGAARDVLALRRLCDRLWPAFVEPVRRGEYTGGPGDFARLMVRNRVLFQSEAGLHDGLLAPAQLAEADFERWRDRVAAGATVSGARGLPVPTASATSTSSSAAGPRKTAHDLPFYGKFLLIAAFVASHNPARTDAVLFMKMHEKKRRKISGAGYRGPGRPPKHRRGITRKLLGPQPFGMERWLAIFYAILPDDGDDEGGEEEEEEGDEEDDYGDDHGDGDGNDGAGGGRRARGAATTPKNQARTTTPKKQAGTATAKRKAPSASTATAAAAAAVAGSADILTQVATLAALRLVVRAGGGGGGAGGSLTTDPGTKWRANVGLEYVQGLARQVRFDVGDYLTEG